MTDVLDVGPQAEIIEPDCMHLPDRIAETFAGKTLFITGGTGLVGKVLVDKILRRCRDVKKLYLLVREKHGKSGEKRIDDLFESPLFDLLKSDPSNDFRSKISVISGDVVHENLGISDVDRKLLIEEVNIVYHSAACVRFDQPLKRMILMNVRGTKFMLDLTREMKNLQLLFYVSTAYAHTTETILEEKMYDPPVNPHDALRLINILSEDMLNTIASKYMAGYPNTYSFSKALAEGLVNEEIKSGRLPIVIIRPSVVVPLHRIPLPGWIDNLNGPMGLLIAAGKGILRTMYMPKKTYADFIPVDIAINAVCVITYAYLAHPERRHEWSVFNLTTSPMIKLTWEEIINRGRRLAQTKVPFNWAVWYPGGSITCCYYWHIVNFYLKQLIPAMVGDVILRCLRIKPVLMKVQQRISNGYEIFYYYTSNQWIFKNDNLLQLRDRMLNEKEAAIYLMDATNFDIEQYFINGIVGARRYLIHESDATFSTAKKHMKVLFVVDKVFQLFLLYLLFCLLCKLYTCLFC